MENLSSVHNLLAELLEKHAGQKLVAGRQLRIEMALKPVLLQHSIPDIHMLVSLLADGGDAQLARDCVESILNYETCFFREPASFALLTDVIFDAVRERRKQNRTLRIWSVACSSGQEPYSIAISMAENAKKWRGWDVEIIATDVSRKALEKAKAGRYSQFEIQRGLPVGTMLKHFRQEGKDWILDDDIRRRVQFSEHNLTAHNEAFGTFDVVLCRNVLMYLTEENRSRALTNISRHLSRDGFLMLGAAETVIGSTGCFVPSPEYRGFYESAEAPLGELPLRLSA